MAAFEHTNCFHFCLYIFYIYLQLLLLCISPLRRSHWCPWLSQQISNFSKKWGDYRFFLGQRWLFMALVFKRKAKAKNNFGGAHWCPRLSWHQALPSHLFPHLCNHRSKLLNWIIFIYFHPLATAVWTRIEMCRDFFVKASLTFFDQIILPIRNQMVGKV